MTSPRRLSLLMTGALLAATFMASPSFAQGTEQRLQKLEEDVQGINRKFDALLELIQQQAPTVSAPTSGSAPSHALQAAVPPAKPESIRVGQLYLDVFALPTIKGALPTEWAEIPIGSAAVEGNPFRFDAYQSLDATKQLVGHREGILMRWTGYLYIKKGGIHTFLNKSEYNGGSYSDYCKSSIKINGSDVAVIDFDLSAHKRIWIKQGKMALEPGFYDFQLSLVCSENHQFMWDRISVTASMAAPGERIASPIPASLFGIAE